MAPGTVCVTDVRRSPYRTAAPTANPEPEGGSSAWDNNGELAYVFLFVWAVSLMRVVAGALGGETFGAEASIAVLAVLMLPPTIWRSLRSRQRRPSPR